MGAGIVTTRMIAAYYQEATPTMFLSSLFASPRRNFYRGKTIQYDIVRSGEQVSPVITDLSTGYIMNSNNIYDNKEFTAPTVHEAIPINSWDLLNRRRGRNPFEDPEFRADLILEMFEGMRLCEGKVRRNIELQASQILTTGQLSLYNEQGNVGYTVDFKPKATHFPTAGTAWNASGADPMGDMSSLSNVIRNDGKNDVTDALMGEASFHHFVRATDVDSLFDNRRINQGDIIPFQLRGRGAQYRGTIDVDNYKINLWTYGGRYEHPSTGTLTKYIPDNRVIMLTTGDSPTMMAPPEGRSEVINTSRLEATFGAIPNIGQELGVTRRLIPELPGRFSNDGRQMDLTTNMWLSIDGSQLYGAVGTRPLLLPKGIDTFGCLNTGV